MAFYIGLLMMTHVGKADSPCRAISYRHAFDCMPLFSRSFGRLHAFKADQHDGHLSLSRRPSTIRSTIQNMPTVATRTDPPHSLQLPDAACCLLPAARCPLPAACSIIESQFTRCEQHPDQLLAGIDTITLA